MDKVGEKYLESLNKEKQDIIRTDGNVLVVANPGTGKTKILSYKCIYLLKNGLKPEEILCLTFTKKAKEELEERIISLINKENLKVDISKLNIHTFHSYALEQLGDKEIISSNLLRFAIYRYFKDNDILDYGDEYLLSDIVPRTENLIRFLKSFGIMPDKIDLVEVKKQVEGNEKISKEEMDKYTEYFKKIFEYYEAMKKKSGIDYNDMLIQFKNIERKTKFKYVLIDELQDVNNIEADISIDSAENFVAVGDKKQAIFGFQGGSIRNFKKFAKATQFVLSENFRSKNEILDYAREYFVIKTKDDSNKSDLKNLKNNEAKKGVIPKIYDVEKEKSCGAICELVNKLKKEVSPNEKIAVIARTNGQIMKISQEMKNRGIDHSASYFSASQEAKESIIIFLRGLMSNNLNEVKKAMFSVFAPCTIQKACEICTEKADKLEDLLKVCPELRELREKAQNIQEINNIFLERIIPISISYGKEWLMAALTVQEAFKETIKNLEAINMKNIIDYLKSSDMLADEADKEKQIVLTSVHKSKGKQYSRVIYAPSKTKDTSSFQDDVVEAILKTHKINSEEELEEEALRIDFVAFTRAENELYIITDKLNEYLNSKAEVAKLEISEIETFDLSERSRRAFSLFVNKDYEKAKALLEEDKKWLINFVNNYFEKLDHLSYSSVKQAPLDYFVGNILRIREDSDALSLGTEMHNIAEIICKGGKCEVDTELKVQIKENIQRIVNEITKDYPELVGSEIEINPDLNKIIETDQKINFSGKIDAIFKNKSNQYIIVDWKTDRDTGRASEHRQQLEAYRKVYSAINNISINNIKVAIGFVALRPRIKTGKTSGALDSNQPRAGVFDTFKKKVDKVLAWKQDSNNFFNDLTEQNLKTDSLWKAVVEQYQIERGANNGK